MLNKKERAGICEKRRIFVGNKIVLAGVKKQTLDLPNLVKFSDIFVTSCSGTLQSEDNNPEGIYDFITAAEKWKKHDSYSHDQEAIIYAVGAEGSLGRAHYVNGKFVASTLCLILTPKNPQKYPVDLEFYSYYLMAIREKIVTALRNGTSKLTIKPEELDEYPIEYFDITEQRSKKNTIVQRIKEFKALEEQLKQAEHNLYNDVSFM